MFGCGTGLSGLFVGGHGHADFGLLVGAVGVDKTAAQVHNLLATPADHHTGLGSDGGHHHGLEVLLVGILQHLLSVGGVYHHGHALLALADSQLCAVQAGIFLWYLVEVDLQAVGQLADGHAYAAGTEIVALLYQARHLLAAEQALNLALGGGVTFLHLGTAGGQRRRVVGFRCARGTAAAIAAGTASQQDDYVARVAGQAFHLAPRRRSYHSTNLHALGYVVGVVYLVHQSGGQAYLVAVAAIAMGGSGDDFALRQLAGESLAQRLARVGGASHPHGLVDVGAAAQRVADAAAKAGGRATEGLNLRRVVVGLVFEVHQPFLGLAVHLYGHHNAAGVDFVAHLLVFQQTCFAQTFGSEGAEVHQTHIFVGTSFVLLFMVGQILLECLFQQWAVCSFVKLNPLQLGGEGGVAAVVAPVGVQHTYLGHTWVAVLLVVEIALYMLEVGKGHGQPQRVIQLLQLWLGHRSEAVEYCHIGRLVVVLFQGLGFGSVAHAAVNGVDAVLHHLVALLRGQGAAYHVGRGRADDRLFGGIQQTHTLHGTVCTLVAAAPAAVLRAG